MHTYATALTWEGSTGAGYEAYDRTHQVTAAPARTTLELASDPAFGGDPDLLDPEQLLVAATSSCQLLSFLAVAARARLDVVSYTDHAHGEMPDDESPMRITRIELHPTVVLAETDGERPTAARLAHLTEVAHRECFIANSLTTEVVVSPTFSWSGESGGAAEA